MNQCFRRHEFFVFGSFQEIEIQQLAFATKSHDTQDKNILI